MKAETPEWALRAATTEDHGFALTAQSLGRMRIKWPDLKALRKWARQRGWPAPWMGFQQAFIARMLASREDFEIALEESGIEVLVPKQDYTISTAMLAELDALYDERSPSGRPTGWRALVAELREIRRAVEAGVVVRIEGGPELRTWQGFYGWAHGRYHMLEDGYDQWIGNDAP